MRLRALFLAIALLAVPVSVAIAHDYKLEKLKIHHPWAGATPAGAKVGGGYVAITNYGDEADTLLRHFLQRGSLDEDGIRHSTKVAWRALALLQKEIEEKK